MTNYKEWMWSPIRFVSDVIPLYYRIMGWRYATGYLILQATTLLTLNYLSYYVSRKSNFILNNSIFSIYNNLACSAELEDTCNGMDPQLWEKFEHSFYPIIPLVAMKVGISTVQYVVMKYYETTLARKVSDSLNKEKLSNQIAYNISKNPANGIEIGSIFPDAVLFGESSALMMSALIAIQNSVLVLNDLISMSSFIPIASNVYIPDVATYFFLYGLATNFVTQFISSHKAKWETDVEKKKIELKAMQSYDDSNIGLITLSSGEEYVRSRQDEKIQQIRYAHNWMLFYSSALNLWHNLHSSIYGLSKYYLFGWRVFSQTLLYEYRWGIFDILNSAEKAFSWTNDNSDAISKIGKVSDRILKFLNEVDRQKNFEYQGLIVTDHKRGLMLKNVSISNVLQNISFNFSRGFYLITARSGLGKSTFLKHVANVINSENKYSSCDVKGVVEYPILSKVLLLSQQDFFPSNSTVLDCLYYPNKPEIDLEKKNDFVIRAKGLLQSIKFNDQDLNDLENRDIKKLSGGQQKKIKLVSAILQNPSLLFLDESFNGLDEESKVLVFDLLKRELSPEAIVLIVDHDEKFYNKYDEIKLLELKKDDMSEGRSLAR